MNNKDKNNNMKIILTSIVTVVIAILLLTTTNQAETIQSESPITDCQRRCRIPQFRRFNFPHPHIKLPLNFQTFYPEVSPTFAELSTHVSSVL